LHGFKRVNLKERMGDKINIKNNNACSSCVNALILSIMSAPEIDFSKKTFYVGSKFDGIRASGNSVAFGKCCIESLDRAHHSIPGCPPYPFELKKRLGAGGKKKEI
jgi:hypothetical protein